MSLVFELKQLSEEPLGGRDSKEKLSVFWDCLVAILLYNFAGSTGTALLPIQSFVRAQEILAAASRSYKYYATEKIYYLQ